MNLQIDHLEKHSEVELLDQKLCEYCYNAFLRVCTTLSYQQSMSCSFPKDLLSVIKGTQIYQPDRRKEYIS